MYFDIYLNKKYQNSSLGTYCDLLAKFNIGLYHYDNKKYWGRINHEIDNSEIDYLDQMARKFNEKRAFAKNRIDEVLAMKIKGLKPASPPTSQTSIPFQVFPISLMVDMLVTENIRLYDFALKNKPEALNKSYKKTELLTKTIDEAFENALKSRSYNVDINIRTFDK